MVNTSPVVFPIKPSIGRSVYFDAVEGLAGRIGPPPAHILETEVDGEISLYDPHSESVLVLNQTASDVWRLSDGEHTLADMVRLLAAAYGQRPKDIHDDVEKAVRNIIEEGFLPS